MIYPPVYRRVLWGAVEVTVYGTCRDWNFSGENHSEMEFRNPWISSAIAQVIAEHDIKRALAPKPAFNGQVVRAGDLKTAILAGFFRGADADGVLLEQSGEAFLVASADCPTVIVYEVGRHRALCMHCGLDALVDRGAIEGKRSRHFQSVIDAGTSMMPTVSSGREHAFIAAGIDWIMFDHQTSDLITGPDGDKIENTRAQENKRLIEYLAKNHDSKVRSGQKRVVKDKEYGSVDLVNLIRAQLVRHQVPLDNIEHDGHDTYGDKYHDGTSMFHSNRRDHDQKRNLVVVKLL